VKTALFISIVCSAGACRNRQTLGFEQESETYGDLLAAIRSIGWVLQMIGGRVEEARCPSCERALQAMVAQTPLADDLEPPKPEYDTTGAARNFRKLREAYEANEAKQRN